MEASGVADMVGAEAMKSREACVPLARFRGHGICWLRNSRF